MLLNNSSNASVIEIKSNCFFHNLSVFKSLVNNQSIAVVVKSNAYGHGLLAISTLCQKSSLVSYICVFYLSEALFLRANGISKPILVLGCSDASLEAGIIQGVDFTVSDFQTAKKLNDIAASLNQKAYVQIKVDTGLSRFGVLWDKAVELCSEIVKLKNIALKGAFSHLAESDNADTAFTLSQINRFEKVINELKRQDMNIPFVHLFNSTAAVRFKSNVCNMVRIAGGAYGLLKSQEIFNLLEEKTGKHVKPILSWKSRVIYIKKISAGASVGYNRTFTAKKDMKIGLVPVGYADGFNRDLSNEAFVYVSNQKAPVVGLIAMNMTTIDVTDIFEVKVGTEIELLGFKSGITAEDWSSKINILNYQVTTLINPNINRILV